MAIFQADLGYRCQNVSIMYFIGAKDDGGGGDNWSCEMCKVTVKSSPPTNQHSVFLQAGCASCRPTNSVKALKANSTIILYIPLENYRHR